MRLPSPVYQFRSDDLWLQYLDGQIDQSRYLELLEQAKAEETESEREIDKLLGRTTSTTKYVEEKIANFEGLCRKARAEEARKKSLTPHERYKEDVSETVERYRKESKRYGRIANYLQIIIIVGSVLATGATSAIGSLDIFKWIAPAISIIVAISAGISANFKFRERSFNLQQTADAIEQEYRAVNLETGAYKTMQKKEALAAFADRVEFLIDEQKKRQQQLEQPPDIKHGISHS